MNEIATARVNTFASPRDQLITLTYGQLQDLLQEAVKPLQDQINELSLRLDAHSRKLFSEDLQPAQVDRGDILRALLAANGGKMFEKEARSKMRISKTRFSELLAKMPDDIGVKPYHLDARRNIIFSR